ncbi:MAG TPA: FtsX-like permease family protein, partial [Vicinamibacterales bacterium]|nr:FtsX-like permease family protein [Vicinamibacterales bacterium]
HRFRAVLVASFAAVALVLAMIGVFGVLGYSVQQRAREFGVRMALGATIRDVLSLVVGSAARLLAAGAAIGFVLAALLARVLSTVLFGVQPIDLVTFGSVLIVLLATGAVAVLLPAWRAAHLDPVVALRSE